MTVRTVTGIFENYDLAAEAVREIEALGMPSTSIGLVTNERHGTPQTDVVEAVLPHGHETPAEARADVAAATGAGVLVTAGMMALGVAVPGIGPLIALGWFGGLLVGGGMGTVGGVCSLLIDHGHEPDHVNAYEEAVRAGSTLVSVRTEESLLPRVDAVLVRCGATGAKSTTPVAAAGVATADTISAASESVVAHVHTT